MSLLWPCPVMRREPLSSMPSPGFASLSGRDLFARMRQLLPLRRRQTEPVTRIQLCGNPRGQRATRERGALASHAAPARACAARSFNPQDRSGCVVTTLPLQMRAWRPAEGSVEVPELEEGTARAWRSPSTVLPLAAFLGLGLALQLRAAAHRGVGALSLSPLAADREETGECSSHSGPCAFWRVPWWLLLGPPDLQES